MPRFFSNEIGMETAIIRGDDARHLIKVLRIRPGEQLTLCDQKGIDYTCEVGEITADTVECKVLEHHRNETEPMLRVTLYQALPKADKFEFILQKAVELGVSRVVPVNSKFCVAKMDEISYAKKKPRYEKIIFEAAKQCGRGIIPEIGGILSFEQALVQMCKSPAMVFYEGGGQRIRELVSPGMDELSILIGSEGGFSEQEIAACEQAGVSCVTLGKRILRCETAPIAALALILEAAGEL